MPSFAALEAEDHVLISAGTLAEALIVAAMRNIAEELSTLIDGLGFEIVSLTPASARQSPRRTGRGKGVHRAGLNFGDCFAYEVAATHGCRLLCVGGDFPKTDSKGIF